MRLSFPQLFEAKSTNGGKPRFGCSFLLDPKREAHAKQIKMLRKVAVEIAQRELEVKLAADKIFIRKDGPWQGYEDMWYVSSANPKRPQSLNLDKSPVTAEDNLLYAGCYVDAVIRPWAQNNQHGKRVNAGLEIVRFRSDGEAFGAAGASKDLLDDLDDEDGEDEGMGDDDGLDDEDGL